LGGTIATSNEGIWEKGHQWGDDAESSAGLPSV
jgi:hypothetical protein